MWAHIRDDPPKAERGAPGARPGHRRVIARSMAKEPEDRYATCREFARAASGGPRRHRAAAASPATPGRHGRRRHRRRAAPWWRRDARRRRPAAAGAARRRRAAARRSGGGGRRPQRRQRSRPDRRGARVVADRHRRHRRLRARRRQRQEAHRHGDRHRRRRHPGDTGAGVQTTERPAAAPAESSAAARAARTRRRRRPTPAPDRQHAPVEPTRARGPNAPGSTLFADDTFSTVEETTPATPARPPAPSRRRRRPRCWSSPSGPCRSSPSTTSSRAATRAPCSSPSTATRASPTAWSSRGRARSGRASPDGAIQFGCLQTPDLDEPVCTDGTDREQEYRNLIQQFVNGLLSAEAVDTNFGALAAQGPPVLSGEMTGQPVACIQSVGSGTARLCVREDSIITEVTVVENGQGGRRPRPPRQPRRARGRLRAARVDPVTTTSRARRRSSAARWSAASPASTRATPCGRGASARAARRCWSTSSRSTRSAPPCASSRSVADAPELTPAVARAVLLENDALVLGRFRHRDGAVVIEQAVLGGPTLHVQEVRISAWAVGWAAAAFARPRSRAAARASPSRDALPVPRIEPRRGGQSAWPRRASASSASCGSATAPSRTTRTGAITARSDPRACSAPSATTSSVDRDHRRVAGAERRGDDRRAGPRRP